MINIYLMSESHVLSFTVRLIFAVTKKKLYWNPFFFPFNLSYLTFTKMKIL